MPATAHRNRLAAWMINQFRSNPEHFPQHGAMHYDSFFADFENHMYADVHPQVERLAASSDKGGFLTDHGPAHIANVMRKAAELVDLSSDGDEFSTTLTPYEAFILLMSIHCHDVGNIYGREGHETRILDIMSRTNLYSRLRQSEWVQIAQIASVHGGTVDDDKDTIGRVIAEGKVDILSQSIRPQLLAAVLRIADEVSDDYTRASNFGLITGTLPSESEVYHRYAKSLESVKLDKTQKTIRLQFTLYPDDILEKFGKRKDKDGTIHRVYLLDEIHRRTRKTFSEMLYCMQFMRQWPIHFHKVSVMLNAFIDAKTSITAFVTHNYVFREKGYPNHAETEMKDLCEGFDDLNGEELKQRCESQVVPS